MDILGALAPLQARVTARPGLVRYDPALFAGVAPPRPEFVRRGVRQLALFYLLICRSLEWHAGASEWRTRDDDGDGAPDMAAVSPLVDEFWHAHVLATREYREFWEARGREVAPAAKALFVEHFPLPKEFVDLADASRDELFGHYRRTAAGLRALADELAQLSSSSSPGAAAGLPQTVVDDLLIDRAPDLTGDATPSAAASQALPAFAFWPRIRVGGALPLTCTDQALRTAQALA